MTHFETVADIDDNALLNQLGVEIAPPTDATWELTISGMTDLLSVMLLTNKLVQ
jgi:hypothetical protein